MLNKGVYGGDSFASILFQVPNMSPEEVTKAKAYLKMKTGEEHGMVYVSSNEHHH